MISFIAKHWAGEFSVSRSLWIHTLIPDIAVLALQGKLDPTSVFAEPHLGKMVLFLTMFLWLSLLVWQFVGCFRSASTSIGYTGSTMNLYIVLFVLVVLGFPVLGGFLQLSDQYIQAQGLGYSNELAEKSYVLTLIDDESLGFSGEISFGATRELVSILETHPKLKRMQLDSQGGIIVEARGMANTIMQQRLNTHVIDECFSACTLVYISGQSRTLDDEAKLGFHQYLVDSPYFYPWVDPALEHEKDRQLFTRQNVSPEFVTKMFDHDHNSLWIPSHAELMQAGVTTLEK